MTVKKLIALTASCALLIQGAVHASNPNPLDNEDILTSHIAPHLTIQDCFQASRVCRNWNKAFEILHGSLMAKEFLAMRERSKTSRRNILAYQ
jgi:hypothetical protein